VTDARVRTTNVRGYHLPEGLFGRLDPHAAMFPARMRQKLSVAIGLEALEVLIETEVVELAGQRAATMRPSPQVPCTHGGQLGLPRAPARTRGQRPSPVQPWTRWPIAGRSTSPMIRSMGGLASGPAGGGPGAFLGGWPVLASTLDGREGRR
jgi:hypothetical protein